MGVSDGSGEGEVGGLPLLQTANVDTGLFDDFIAITAGMPVCSGAKPQILPIAPVGQVVLRCIARGARPIRYFVMRPAGIFQQLTGQCVLVGGHIGIGRCNLAVVQPAVHRRTWFNGQAVKAQVLRFQFQGCAQAVLPRC